MRADNLIEFQVVEISAGTAETLKENNFEYASTILENCDRVLREHLERTREFIEFPIEDSAPAEEGEIKITKQFLTSSIPLTQIFYDNGTSRFVFIVRELAVQSYDSDTHPMAPDVRKSFAVVLSEKDNLSQREAEEIFKALHELEVPASPWLTPQHCLALRIHNNPELLEVTDWECVDPTIQKVSDEVKLMNALVRTDEAIRHIAEEALPGALMAS